MITTVIFDVGGVQITGLRGVEDSITSKLNLNTNEATSNLEGKHLDDFCNGRISEDEYLTSVIREAGWNIKPDDLKRGIRENFREIDGTREIISDLKASRNYHIRSGVQQQSTFSERLPRQSSLINQTAGHFMDLYPDVSLFCRFQ